MSEAPPPSDAVEPTTEQAAEPIVEPMTGQATEQMTVQLAEQPAGAAESAADPYTDLHKASDPMELRALAHPIRLALYEALGIHGSLTATQASKLVGGSPTSVAYHLRTLAKYGYAEEAGGGAGRERPWRLKRVGLAFGQDGSPGAAAAARTLGRLLFQRWLERREHYREHREQWPAEVREASGDYGFLLFGTLEEYTELQQAWGRLIMPYHSRINDPSLRPEGSMVFELNLYTNPIEVAPPVGDDEDDEDEHVEED
jgi:DNA-binding transcriptional ArsR family regulator